MKSDYEKLLQEAVLLPPDSRAKLAEQLIDSLDEEVFREFEASWKQEIQDRLKAYHAGEMKAIPADEVYRKIQAGA